LDLPEFRRRFAKRVRLLREDRDLRQEDLENFGLSWKSVQKIEYGKTDPKISTLLKLCHAFNLSLPELLTFRGEQRRKG
jgi:transcriptional regulator with XRE-family HTH domain